MNSPDPALHQQSRSQSVSPAVYGRVMLGVAGLGGLLYGIDVGIISGALPYLESTASVAWHLSAQQLGFVVAAVLLGSVLSSLVAGALADAIGRRRTMMLAGLLFSVSIPMIALADGYVPLLLGRLMQGVSGGLVGVAVPLYLAECLAAEVRGRGTALFQLLLTLGLVLAALIGLYQASSVEAASQAAAALATAAEREQALFASKDHAWRMIFWICLLPGVAFTLGAAWLAESPRWLLVQRGRVAQAAAALARSRSADAVAAELQAMRASVGAGAAVAVAADADADADADAAAANAGALARANDPLWSRRYVLPFLLACLCLACTQATGINSILAYEVTILNDAGLPGSVANMADVAVKLVNALMTVLAVQLIDRRGRKFLLVLGTGGIALSLCAMAALFYRAEAGHADVLPQMQALVRDDAIDSATVCAGPDQGGAPQQLSVAYAYGGFSNVASCRSDQPKPLRIARADTVQADSALGAMFRQLHLNPFPDPASAAGAPLRITRAERGPVPPASHGWLVALCLTSFVAFFALGPGVCVWLVLSELMPTRIRSNGMSVALLINQFVSTVFAALFLPVVGAHGYASVFALWAAITVLYFLTALFALPETKGKTLEEIDQYFAGKR